MVNLTLKRAVAIAVLAGASIGAHAAEQSLGPVHLNTPTSFNGTIEVGAKVFNDIFTFTPDTPNFGTGATVVNIPLTVPGPTGDQNWATVLNTFTLMSAGAGVWTNDNHHRNVARVAKLAPAIA